VDKISGYGEHDFNASVVGWRDTDALRISYPWLKFVPSAIRRTGVGRGGLKFRMDYSSLVRLGLTC
jgi:hypothetical protein